MSEPILPLRQWPAGIQQASVPANDNALRDEAMERPCLGVANDASGSDVNGDLWIVGDTPTGAFATFEENDVALYQFDSWYAWAPTDGLRLIVAGVPMIYVGGSTDEWQEDTSEGLPDAPSDGTTYGRKDGAWVAAEGTGDVAGPASATDEAVALYDGTTGKLLKNGSTIATIRSIPQNSQSTAYTAVLADAGKHLLHPSADTTARTFTIPANSSVAFPVGTALTFVNQASAGVVTIAITTDTMRLAGAGTTGSRTLAANGIATALKITSTEWIISGTGLT